MKKRNVDNLTIEIPDGLDSYNSQYQLKVINNGNEDVEIKLYLEPLTTENINDEWYKIEPESASRVSSSNIVENELDRKNKISVEHKIVLMLPSVGHFSLYGHSSLKPLYN